MTREFSNYMKRFFNLNLDIKSIRQEDRQTKTETDRQTKSETDRQIETDSVRTQLSPTWTEQFN